MRLRGCCSSLRITWTCLNMSTCNGPPSPLPGPGPGPDLPTSYRDFPNPDLPEMFKLVHYVVCTVNKWTVGILLKCLLVEIKCFQETYKSFRYKYIRQEFIRSLHLLTFIYIDDIVNHHWRQGNIMSNVMIFQVNTFRTVKLLEMWKILMLRKHWDLRVRITSKL